MANLIELLWDLVERPAIRDEYRGDPASWLAGQGLDDLTGEDVAATLEVVRDLVEAEAADLLADVAPSPRVATPTPDETPFEAAVRLLDQVVDAVADLPEAPPRPDPVGPLRADQAVPASPPAAAPAPAAAAPEPRRPERFDADRLFASAPSEPERSEPAPIALGAVGSSPADSGDDDHDDVPAPHLTPVPTEPATSGPEPFVPLSFGSSGGLSAVPEPPDQESEPDASGSAGEDQDAAPGAFKSSSLKLPTIGVQASDWARDEDETDPEE